MEPLNDYSAFSMETLLKASNKIAYMDRFSEITLYDPSSLIENKKFLLNIDEFKVFASKCINLDCVGGGYERQLIHKLCEINCLDIIRILVKYDNVYINCVDSLGKIPLHFACENGDEALELIKFLVENGADINCIDKNGSSLLYVACKNGNKSPEFIRYLLDNGADFICGEYDKAMNAIKLTAKVIGNVDGKYLIHTACEKGNLKLVRLLVLYGADVNCVDGSGCLPIHYACNGGDNSLEIVRCLVAYGANVNCADINDRYPIHIACEKGDNSLKLVKYLVAIGADVNRRSKWRHPIHIACEIGALELIKCLVLCGADINCINDNGLYPIQVACLNGDESLQLIKCLIECGADIKVQSILRRHLIHYACNKGDGALELVKCLIEYGADVNCADIYKRCPIHYASERGAFELVKFLVANGANINCTNVNNQRLIHYVSEKRTELVKFLVANGADVICTDIYDGQQRPMHFDLEMGLLELVK